MRRTLLAFLWLSVVLVPARAAFAQALPQRTLVLAFEADGAVSLKGQNVTVREILAEWASRCGCYIVNAAQLAGAPLQIPVVFERAPQAAVLESLLRQAAGYVLTPKRAGSTSASNYDVIYILATSTASSTPAPSYTSAYPSSLAAAPISTVGSPDDEIPPVQPIRTNNQPATPPPPAPTTRTNSPGVSIVPIVPVTSGWSAPVAPGTSAPASR